MYAVKPVLTRFEDIELPTCMYRIKSQELGDAGGGSDDFLNKLTKQVEMIVRKVAGLAECLRIITNPLNVVAGRSEFDEFVGRTTGNHPGEAERVEGTTGDHEEQQQNVL